MQRAWLRRHAGHGVTTGILRSSLAVPLVVRRARASSARPSSRQLLPSRAVAVQASSDEEVIDPITGMPISKTSVQAPVAGFSVKIGQHTWAYRRSEPVAAAASPDKPTVLLLHGLGSSSYCYRATLGLLGGEGYDAIAVDWIGHGGSDKPQAGFDYSEEAYIKGLEDFVAAIGIKQPFALVVHGYILGQYGLLYAQRHPELVDRLLILNTPVSSKTGLRPELAAYKAPLPFMRPGKKPFDGAMFNASGSPYAMQYGDASIFNRPYQESPAASEVIAKTMDKVDFGQLVKRVDQGFTGWRIPTALCFGGSDPFISISTVFDFLEDKRTNMRAMSLNAKMGHMPQEDYAEVLHDQMMLFLQGTPDDWAKAQSKTYKMTKKGMMAE